MNDPKTLQNIAEKARQFDRAHFDDDVPVAAESLLSYHERLPADRKLIMRLRPRYAVALGFFEGYTLAIEDGDELRSGPFIEHLRMLVEAKPHEGLLAALERVRKEHFEFRRSIRKALGDDVESTGSLDGDVRVLVNEWQELKTKLAEAERIGAEHAAQLEDEIRALVAERDRYKREATESKNQTNIGIVIKPPPPPPAAPPAPNELRTEIDDELAHAAAEYANDEEGYPTTARDIDEVRDAMKAGKGWYAVARAFVHGARWQLARIENVHAGDDPTMHLPPTFDRAPIPSDREIAELVCRTIYSGTETSEAFIRRIVDEIKGDDLENVRRKVATTYGSVSEVCAIKFALLHFRDRLVGPANEVQNAERTQYETTIRQKNERIAELEKQLGFDCVGGTEKGEGVEAKLELKIQKQNDLLRLQNADLNKAQSRIAELEEQLKDEIENLNETARENVKLANDASELRAAITGYFQNEHRSNSASLAARNHLRSLVGLSSSRSATPVSGNPGSGELYVENGNVMFRNASGDASVVAASELLRWVRLHALREGAVFETVKGTRAVKSEYHYPDGGIECVLLASGEYAHFGDTNENHNDVLVRELVVPDPKEPKRDYSLAPDPIVFRDDAECDYWEEMSHVLATKKDTTPQSVATAADEMVEERRKRLHVRVVSENDTRTVIIGVRVADEVTDELLLEAAKFAASMVESAPGADDLDMARSAVSLPFLHVHRWTARSWGLLVRGYVNGAQRSSRKP